MGVATLLYSLIAVLASFIIDDLGISRAQLGLVVTSFSAVAAIASPVVGRATDAVGARAGMLAIFTLSGLGFLLFGIAPGVFGLMGAAMIVGISQALANPATNKMIAHEFEAGHRGVITGVKQSGVQVGTFLAGLTFPAIAAASGWRTVPIMVAVAVAVMLTAAFVGLPSHDAPIDRIESSDRQPLPSWVWWLTLYAFLMGAGGSPIYSFLPLYATEVVGMSERGAGLVLGLAGLVGIVSRIAWSAATERRGELLAPLLILALMAVVAALMTASAVWFGVVMLWAAAFFAFMSISAWNPIAMLAVIVRAGPALAGRASGVVLFGFIAGLGLSPPLFGWSVDRFGTYTPGFITVGVVFTLAAFTITRWSRSTEQSPTGRVL